MTRVERERYLKREIGYRICSFMEDLEHEGKITREEKNNWYKRFASLGMSDFLPRSLKLHPYKAEKLKKEIKDRVVKEEKKPAIPGPKPAPVKAEKKEDKPKAAVVTKLKKVA